MNTSDTPDLTLIIPAKFPSLNEYSNAKNRIIANSMKQKWTNLVASYAALQKQHFSRAYFSFLWVEENKRRDPDNICFSKKFIFDGFVKAKLIPNDGWSVIEGFDDNFTIDKKQPRVEIGIWQR